MPGNTYCLSRLTYLQGQVNPSLLADLEAHACLFQLAKAGSFHREGVVTRGKRRDYVISALLADGRARDGGRDVDGCNGRVGNRRAGRVENVPAQFRRSDL